jgi:hypothetical protein
MPIIGDQSSGFGAKSVRTLKLKSNRLLPTYRADLAAVLLESGDESGTSSSPCSAELSHRGHMKFAEAHTNMLWGRMLRTRNEWGDADRARRLLEHARESAATHGHGMFERLAMAELLTLAS